MKRKQHSENTHVSFSSNNTEWYNLPITIEELQLAITNSTSKSPGPDNIPYEFLKHFNITQLKAFLKFLNYIYLNDSFPMQWKEAIAIPLLRHGKPATDPSSYRPIALTNCLCKIMEKVLNKCLNLYIERNKSYTSTQSGFRASHSTLDALCRLQHSAREAILEKKFCVAIFLDIEKAFDSVWHHGLLLKIKALNLAGHLPKFIQNFISLRKINVKTGSTLSSSLPLFSGVPQGSVLRPTLFKIYINDIFSNIPDDVNSSLYADDCAIWITDASLTVASNKIQLALNSIEEWSSMWGLTFNVELKTHVIIFTNKRNINYLTLYLHNTSIPYKKINKISWSHI